MQMTYVMNERKYAENILNSNGYGEEKSGLNTTAILAKYYVYLGCSNKEIKTILSALIKERVPKGSESTVWYWINKGMRYCREKPLYEIDEISVSKAEMDRIRQIHSTRFKDERIQKLAFTLLCLAKFAKERGIKDYWVNSSYKEIFSIANIRGQTVEKQCLFLNELYCSEYIQISPKIKSQSIRVLGVIDGETEISVPDINEAGLIYEQYFGKKFVRCNNCGKMIAITNGRNTYCLECAEERNREKTRERMRELGIVP